MVLGNFTVPGRPTIWITVGQGPTALAVAAGGGCLDIFTLIYPFSPLFPSLWETARYRLKYCLKGLLNPKQSTNQKACGLPQGPRACTGKSRGLNIYIYGQKPRQAQLASTGRCTLYGHPPVFMILARTVSENRT